jgi:ankyrin repeat protein
MALLLVRPLRLGELAEIFILDPEKDVPFDPSDRLFSPEAVFTYLPNLVVKLPDEVDDSSASRIKFTHFSIQEYILSQRITQRPTKDFHVEEADAHLHIASSCLTYHLHLSRDILVTEKTFQRFILWSYVSDYWHRHIEKVANSSLLVTLESRVVQLLDRRSRAFLNLSRITSTYGALKADWHLQPEDVRPPLFYCASLASLWPMRFLIENGANIDEVSGNDLSYGSFALQRAITAGKTDNAKFLLHRDANANTQGGYFGNALQAAANYDHVEIVQLLLDKGAEVNAQGGNYGNALQAESRKGNGEIMQLLLNEGADVNAHGGTFGTALQAASCYGNVEIVQLLLDKGADVNAQVGRFGNALQAASRFGHVEIVQLLLDEGAEVNAQGGDYGNALQVASSKGNGKIVQLLLDKGADVNAQGGYFGNALQAALASEMYNVAKLLHSRGARVYPPGPMWEEMLTRVSQGYLGKEKVNRLKEFQADPTAFLAKDGLFKD